MTNRRSAQGSSSLSSSEWCNPIEVLETRRLLSGQGGDANLGGQVNLADFNRLAANFTSYTAGDLNYDGVVNAEDWARLAANFGFSAGPGGTTARDWAYLGVVNTGQPAYFVEGRTLVVLGSPRADYIVVDSAKLEQVRQQYPGSDIRRISVDAGAGNDTIDIRVGLISSVNGARGNDSIYGSSKGDELNGSSGNDVIYGRGGDDRLEGQDGYDQLLGEAGNDALGGGKGHDSLWGNDGDDILFGGGGTDHLWGGRGADQFKSADIAGNADQLGYDRRFDVMLSSDADDEMMRDAK
jgi:Ca2+-binding RTX toxin-like protein